MEFKRQRKHFCCGVNWLRRIVTIRSSVPYEYSYLLILFIYTVMRCSTVYTRLFIDTTSGWQSVRFRCTTIAAVVVRCRDWISLSLDGNLSGSRTCQSSHEVVAARLASLSSKAHRPRPKPTPAERLTLGHSRWFVNRFATARTAIDFLSGSHDSLWNEVRRAWYWMILLLFVMMMTMTAMTTAVTSCPSFLCDFSTRQTLVYSISTDPSRTGLPVRGFQKTWYSSWDPDPGWYVLRQ